MLQRGFAMHAMLGNVLVLVREQRTELTGSARFLATLVRVLLVVVVLTNSNRESSGRLEQLFGWS